LSHHASIGTARHKSSFAGLPPDDIIFGRSAAMREIRHRIALVAKANAPLVLYGESGTGKDVIAQLVHQHSDLANGPFVMVSCPAIPGALMESELFGYEKGDFTGANSSKPGRVEMASGGSLFLDAVSEIELSLQPKLLQLLQDGRFTRIGGFEERAVQVRLICASTRDLMEEVALGRFREDLYFRINVLSLRLPALRERVEDIPMLVEYFLASLNRSFDRQAPPLSPTMIRVFQGYHWPGNIRELENLIKRYVVLGSEEAIMSELRAVHELPIELEIPTDGTSIALKDLTRRAVARLERTVILRVLQAHQWNRKKAAAALQISYRALLYKLKEVGIPPSRGIYALPPLSHSEHAETRAAEDTYDVSAKAETKEPREV
jgi:two-component system response regulator AtoC